MMMAMEKDSVRTPRPERWQGRLRHRSCGCPPEHHSVPSLPLPTRKAVHSQPTCHTRGEFLLQARGSQAVTWGGNREAWWPHWAGSQFLGCALDPHPMLHKYVD